MKHFLRISVLSSLILSGAIQTMATEEAKFDVIKKDKAFELREYAPHVLAETVIENGSMEGAGNDAFRLLFGYISGNNQSRQKVAMTAPVSQEPLREKIKMTAPVGQQRAEEGWVVSFMMPASYTLETLPQPENPKVTLRQVPARRMAAVRYTGRWSEKSYLQHKLELEAWMLKEGLTVAGDPVWARYDPPFTLWFMRRNEVLIPVETDSARRVLKKPVGCQSRDWV